MSLPRPSLTDPAGKPIVTGALARLVTIPAELIHDLPVTLAAAVQRQQGAVRPIFGVDPFGNVWFGGSNGCPWFCVRSVDLLIQDPLAIA